MRKNHGQKQDAEDSQQALTSTKTKFPKSAGLFDHIRHIQYVQDPDYYNNLSESDRKTFNIFMILRGLSMNPAYVEYVAHFYRFLDIIPPSEFYKIFITTYPRHRYKEFHRWIKSSKEKDSESAKNESKIIDIIVEKYKIPDKEAKDYIRIFKSSKMGVAALIELICGFGFTKKEAEEMI